MKRTTLGFIALSLFSSGVAFAQAGGAPAKPEPAKPADTKPAAPAGAPAAAPPPGMDPKLMQAMEAYATPGAEHQKLKALAGSWDVAVKFWMDPKAPPQEMKGKSEMKMVLNDHYLMNEFSGDMGGMPFAGIGYIAYNNSLKKYEQVWMDNMSTGLITGSGAADKEGTITFAQQSTNALKGKLDKGRDIWKIEGDKKIVSEMWGPPPKGGKEYKMLEITYTKK
jgi:hypothetical protein